MEKISHDLILVPRQKAKKEKVYSRHHLGLLFMPYCLYRYIYTKYYYYSNPDGSNFWNFSAIHKQEEGKFISD